MCYNNQNQYDVNNRCGGRGFDDNFNLDHCGRGFGRRQSYICFPTGGYWNYGCGRGCYGYEPYGPYYNSRMNFNNCGMSRYNRNFEFNPYTNVVFANCYSGYGWCGGCGCNCRGRLYGGEGRNNNCGC